TKVSAINWNTATAVVRQDDGKVVVGGWVYSGNSSSADFVVARYTTAGVLDASFGTAGMTITPVAPGTKDDTGRAILLQIDDRVPTVRSIVAGSANDANYDFAVTRYWH
ncbi:delta-60 repeat domain-containing protein, partial [Roseateles sp. P5_E8]